MIAPILTPACLAVLGLRAFDGALEGVTIAGARAELAAGHLRRAVQRELGAAWWTWLILRPRGGR